jgi:hypothetical protein
MIDFKYLWIISQFVDQIFCESLTRARKERQIAPQASAGYCFPNCPCLTSAKHSGGREKKSSMRLQDTPATAKKGQLPHDCKQYDFPSGPLQSLNISRIPALQPSTNWEMIHIYLVMPGPNPCPRSFLLYPYRAGSIFLRDPFICCPKILPFSSPSPRRSLLECRS